MMGKVGAAVLSALCALSCSRAADPKPGAASASTTPAPATSSVAPALSAVPAATPPPALVGWRGALAFETATLADLPASHKEPSLVFVDDRTVLVHSGDLASLCDLGSWRCDRPLRPGLSGWTASADGKWLAASDDESTLLFETAGLKEKIRVARRKDAIGDELALSATGDQLLVLASEGIDKLSAQAWGTAAVAGAPLRHLELKQSLPASVGVFTPANTFALWMLGGNGMDLVIEGRPKVPTSYLPPERVAFASDGTAAVHAGLTMEIAAVVRVLDLPSGKERVQFELGPFPPDPSTETRPSVHSIAASRGAARVAMTVTRDRTKVIVLVHDGQTGRVLARLDTPYSDVLGGGDLALSPDGKTLLWVHEREPASSVPKGASPFEILRASLP